MLGLTVDQLASLTPFDFELKCAGYRQSKKIEESMHRKAAFVQIAMNLAKGHNPIHVLNELFPSIYEEHEPKKAMTRKQIQGTFARFNEIREKRLQGLIN